MYSTKEKLRILRELNNPAAVGADLALLRTVCPDDPRMVKFGLSPERHAEEILMSLLDHFTREQIVANRRAIFREKGHTKDEVTSGNDAEQASEHTEAATERANERANEAAENVPETATSEPKPENSVPESANSVPNPETAAPQQEAVPSKKKSARKTSTRT